MIGDLVLRGVSVGTVVEDAPNDYTVYTQYGQKETWPKNDTTQIVSYGAVLSMFERSILNATGNDCDSE